MTDTFVNAVRGLAATGASRTDAELVELLARHGRDEGVMLAGYERYREEAPGAAIRYLVSMIMDDERRHHTVIEEIANSIAWGWEGASPEPGVPSLGRRHRDPAFLEATRELLNAEKADKRELKRLRRHLADYEDSTLWALLVDLMTLDTEKHATILQFVLDHA